MKVLASLAIATTLAQDERGFNYGGFGDYDLSAFDDSYGFDDTYGGFYDYSAPADDVGAGRETEVAADEDEDEKAKGERYFFTTATTTTPPITTVTTVTALPGNNCWKCDQMTYALCASEGSYKTCELGDSDCCFAEIRTTGQKLQQLCTGCKDATACMDNKLENFGGSDVMDNDDQCRPEMIQQKKNSRNARAQSVCRTCFRTCDFTLYNGAFCFGGINGNTPIEFKVGFDTQHALLPMGIPHGRADWAGVIGIPTWALVDGQSPTDTTAVSQIATDPLNVFFGNNVDGKLPASSDTSWDPADMTFWSLIAGDKAWWEDDLKAKQLANMAGQLVGCTQNGANPNVYDACPNYGSDLLGEIGSL